jgi:hypothetical protein
MKFYYIDTQFTFGKYSGKTVREALEIQPSYIDWCAINLDHFYISDDVIDTIKSTKPDFVLSEQGMQKLRDKYEKCEQEKQKQEKPKQEKCKETRDYSDFSYPFGKYGNHYDEYAGTYAQEVAGFSDELIDDVFEGDPDAYWNID